ncbi:MAG: M16 family metallopeptidase [Longimicrobiales bacterium]
MTGPVDRSVAPQTAAAHPYAFPDVAQGRLDNGMAVRTLSKVELPLVTALVFLEAGESTAPTESPGIAVLCGDALEGGTKARPGHELAEALEGMGASFGTATGWDSTTVAISCLADRLSDAMPLLSEMIRRPSFDQTEFDRFRSQRLASIRQRQMDPGSLAGDGFARFLYGDSAAYGRPLGGTEEAVKGFTPKDARAFWEDRYLPDGGGLVMVGDLDLAEAQALADEHFGGWAGTPSSNGPSPTAPSVESAPVQAVHVIHRPGSVQTQIRVGHLGVARSTPDYFPLQVLNLALGGSFTSRLNLNLREKHGYTYGVRSRLVARRSPGPFFVSTAVETKVTKAAVTEIHSEIRQMAESGPTEDEVESARSYLARVFPLKLETTGQVASRVAEMLVYGLESDYYKNYRDRVRKVSVSQTTDAATRHLRPSELLTVLVGDADAIASEFDTGAFGPVTVHE